MSDVFSTIGITKGWYIQNSMYLRVIRIKQLILIQLEQKFMWLQTDLWMYTRGLQILWSPEYNRHYTYLPLPIPHLFPIESKYFFHPKLPIVDSI